MYTIIVYGNKEKKYSKKWLPRKLRIRLKRLKRPPRSLAPKLSDLKYSSGKIDDETLSKIEELEEILGVQEVNHFGTNDPYYL